jgi:non-canonical purine NTP pyrophosphatase (RdgB/HAM1 family)
MPPLKATGLPALADDSGLVVPALGGAPGIYSARWAGPTKDFSIAMARVHRELGDKDRSASFVSVLSLAWPDGEEALFRGEDRGPSHLAAARRQRLRLRPDVRPDGYSHTFGEIAVREKYAIDHRARAFAKLVAACFTHVSPG